MNKDELAHANVPKEEYEQLKRMFLKTEAR